MFVALLLSIKYKKHLGNRTEELKFQKPRKLTQFTPKLSQFLIAYCCPLILLYA